MPLWSRQESCALSSPFPIAAILLSSYPFLISGMLLCWWITDVVQPLDMVNREIKNGVMMLQLDWWGFGSSFLLAAWSLTPWAGAISSSFGIASFVDYEEMSCWCRSWVDFFFLIYDFLFKIHSQWNTLFSTDKSRAQKNLSALYQFNWILYSLFDTKIDFCWNLMLCNTFLLLYRKTEERSNFFHFMKVLRQLLDNQTLKKDIFKYQGWSLLCFLLTSI